MSFNSEARIVRDNGAPIGLRYISLRHCVQMFCPFGFNATWKQLEKRFGLKEGQPNTSEALSVSIEFLNLWRNIEMRRRAAEEEYIRELVSIGLPKRAKH